MESSIKPYGKVMNIDGIQNIPGTMHMVRAWLCLVVVLCRSIYP